MAGKLSLSFGLAIEKKRATCTRASGTPPSMKSRRGEKYNESGNGFSVGIIAYRVNRNKQNQWTRPVAVKGPSKDEHTMGGWNERVRQEAD